MPKYFMGGTRLGGLERMMMDPSRSAPDCVDPPKKPQKKPPRDQPAAPHPPEQRRKEDSV